MRLPRLTTRRLMAVVAVAAIPMGAAVEAVRLWQLSNEYEFHAWSSRDFADAYQVAADQGRIEFLPRFGEDWVQGPPKPAQLAEWRRTSAHFREVARKYDRLARYPWLPVSPDPPEPK